jgi:hypothetical protein
MLSRVPSALNRSRETTGHQGRQYSVQFRSSPRHGKFVSLVLRVVPLIPVQDATALITTTSPEIDAETILTDAVATLSNTHGEEGATTLGDLMGRLVYVRVLRDLQSNRKFSLPSVFFAD